jgi:hypothetical protein
VDTFGVPLVRLARAYEGDADARRDLLQEIHLHLWRSFAQYDQRCSLRTWVYRVAHNVATSHVIRQRRIRSRLVGIEADPRNLWQNQTTESFTMSLDLIRYKVQQREKKSRAETILSIGIAVLLCGVFVWGSIRAQEAIPRVGWALLSFWPIYFAWQTYQWIWPRRLWSDATLSSSLTFYWSELERRRDYTRRVRRRSGLIFCFLGLGMVIVPALLQSSDPFGWSVRPSPSSRY